MLFQITIHISLVFRLPSHKVCFGLVRFRLEFYGMLEIAQLQLMLTNCLSTSKIIGSL
jgi:hypothetical protein